VTMSDKSESEVEHSGSERYEIGNDIARRARTETPRLDVLRDELPELSEKELRLLDDNIEKAIRDTVARTLRDREDRKAVTDGSVDQSEAEGYQSKRIECPNCGMPFDVPEEVDHWSCDCGASWKLDPRTDGGVEAFDPADYNSVREALREAPAGYGVESIIDYFDPVVEGGHEVDVDV